jgi:hypothetical protein
MNRGIADRAVSRRVATPGPRRIAPASIDPELVGFLGQRDIPDALAYALKWQLELVGTPADRTAEQKTLVRKLLGIWGFLEEMAASSPRDPADGALLVDDPLGRFAAPGGKPRLLDVEGVPSIPIVDETQEPSMPVWAPRELPPSVPEEERRRYPARPRSVAQIPPFARDNVAHWIAIRDRRESPSSPKRRTARATKGSGDQAVQLIPIVEPVEKPIGDQKQLDAALERAMAVATKLVATPVAPASGTTPTVRRVIGTLSGVSVQDIERQTGLDVRAADSTEKLIANTRVILYHSVFTFVLDRDGNPFDLRSMPDARGLLDYAILVPSPGSQMQRNLPPPPAVYVSVQKYGYSNFFIDKGVIRKLPTGGVGGFVEYGYGYSGPHVFHRRIQSFLDSQRSSYIASTTVEAAYNRREITLDLLTWRLPQFVEAVIPFAVAEIIERAKMTLRDWPSFARRIGEEALKATIVAWIRGRVRDYLIKKIGVRITPVIGGIAVVHDVLSGDEDRIRVRHALACVLVALKSRSDEDMTISAKVCAKVMGDEFEERLIAELVKMGAQRLSKARPKQGAKAPDQAGRADEGSGIKQMRDAPSGTGDLEVDPGGPASHARPVGTKSDLLSEFAPEDVAAARARIAQELKHQAEAAVRQSTASGPPGSAKASAVASSAEGRPKAGTEEKGTSSSATTSTGTDKPATGDPATTRDWRLRPPRPKRKPQPKPTASSGAPPGPRGTREKPTPVDPAPEPPPEPMVIKDDPIPEDLHDVRDRPNVLTSGVGAAKLLRHEREKALGATPLDHDSHHIGEKAGGKKRGERIRDLLYMASVSVNEAANETPARGLPRDRRAPLESSSQHWLLHTNRRRTQLLKELETVRGDREATKAVLLRHGLGIWDDRKLDELEFYLGPDPDDPSFDDD